MPEPMVPKHFREAIAVLVAYIEKHPFDFSVGKVDEITANNDLYLGKKNLHKHFKAITGHSLKSYEMKKKLESCLQMLEEGRMTISQIADKCGYTSASSFTRAFKEVFNMTPKEYQQRIA